MKYIRFTPTKKIAAWLLTSVFAMSIMVEPVAATQTNMLDFTENDIQTYDPRVCDGTGAADTTLVGADNQEKAYFFFIRNGLTPQQSAGIIGNLQQESGVDPTSNNPAAPPSGIDPGSIIPGETWHGGGIAQWEGGRWTGPNGLLNFVAGKGNFTEKQGDGTDWKVLAYQLNFLWWELNNTERAALDALRNTTTVEDAATVFQERFERPSVPHPESRIQFAREFLEKIEENYGSLDNPGGAGAESAGFCACNPQTRTVVLDPGHSGTTVAETDPSTGVQAEDFRSMPEMQQVWDVSQRVASALETAGFKVVLTKQDVNDSVGQMRRARIANEMEADLAVSIHSKNDSEFAIYKVIAPQRVGLFRRNGIEHQKTFQNQDVAAKSQQYAAIFAEERQKTEDGLPQVRDLDFANINSTASTGNISIEQLYANVPWVYNEVGGRNFDAEKYATGLTNAIKIALLGNEAEGLCGVGNGDAAATAVRYAWPTYKGRGYTVRKPEYITAITSAIGAGKYIGDTCYGGGVDCGGFTTRVMQDSNADVKYNDVPPTKGPVTAQEDYMKRYPDKYQSLGFITSPSQLEPGDIAIAADRGHTFMYVGEQPNFQTHIASASQCDRAPMAGMEALSGNRWYRLK